LSVVQIIGDAVMTRSFDIGTAIFFFFKRFGEKPAAALWIMLWQVVLVGGLGFAALYFIAPAYIEILELAFSEASTMSGGLEDSEAAMRVFEIIGPIIPLLALITPVSIIIVLMFQGAWLRFLTRGHVAAGVPFRFGADEFRLLGVNILYFAVGIAAYIGFIILAVIFGLVIAGVVTAGDGSVGSGLAGGALAFIGVLAVMAIVIAFVVRLATAPALTVLDKRLRFFESWDATSHVFWNMLLSYVAVAFLILVIMMIFGSLIDLIFLGALWPLIEQFIELSQSNHNVSPAEVFATLRDTLSQPGTMITMAIGGMLAYLMRIIVEGMWHGVGAYNAVRHRGEGELEETDAPVLTADHPVGASPSEG
jgi:hypothetical protein